MSEQLTHSIQDYVKVIFELTAGGQSASTTALADQLNVAPASVTGMLQKLATSRTPLIRYRKYQGATLTEAGKRAALEVIRHHRLIEAWLVETLGYGWDEVHEEAERLEHVISEDMEARIARALGEPYSDPHGEPIPTADLVMPPDETIPLSRLRPPRTAVIRRVRPADPALLRHLEELRLLPGTPVEALDYSEFDRNLLLRIGNQQQPNMLGQRITEQIFVEVDR
ncbi:MAG TPA: metal-dependent transcriptional regulator [Anaerolineales bacterium]|nr:metal-dependent transcriptional regulator [Anaerolineales bacterium]